MTEVEETPDSRTSGDSGSAALDLVLRSAVEVVERSELEKILGEMESGAGAVKPSAYIGIEPSGFIHIGQLICLNKVRHLLEAGFEVVVLLADWHAYINNKLGADMDNIRTCGEYLKDVFAALGITRDRYPGLKFIWAAELVDGADYWERVIRVSKNTSMNRMKRAITIMGRKEDAVVEASMYIYPAMQVTDIFQLEVDVAYGGIDQRKAHMLARDVADKLGMKPPIALHTPLLAGLTGGDRMNPEDAKMSKSKPDSNITLHDSGDEIRRKIKKAFCPIGQVEGNPILEICRYIIFDAHDELVIDRPEKWGGPLRYGSYEELEKAFVSEECHPADLKKAVAGYLCNILEPVRDYFRDNPGNFKKLKKITVTR
jgi:tyrosyl-tRNA synthetase